MGKQYNKVVKRRRRKAYLVRKKTLTKQGITRRVSRAAKSPEAGADAGKKAKKPLPAAKKAPKSAAKKAPKALEEVSVPVTPVHEAAPEPAAVHVPEAIPVPMAEPPAAEEAEG